MLRSWMNVLANLGRRLCPLTPLASASPSQPGTSNFTTRHVSQSRRRHHALSRVAKRPSLISASKSERIGRRDMSVARLCRTEGSSTRPDTPTLPAIISSLVPLNHCSRETLLPADRRIHPTARVGSSEARHAISGALGTWGLDQYRPAWASYPSLPPIASTPITRAVG